MLIRVRGACLNASQRCRTDTGCPECLSSACHAISAPRTHAGRASWRPQSKMPCCGYSQPRGVEKGPSRNPFTSPSSREQGQAEKSSKSSIMVSGACGAKASPNLAAGLPGSRWHTRPAQRLYRTQKVRLSAFSTSTCPLSRWFQRPRGGVPSPVLRFLHARHRFSGLAPSRGELSTLRGVADVRQAAQLLRGGCRGAPLP